MNVLSIKIIQDHEDEQLKWKLRHAYNFVVTWLYQISWWDLYNSLADIFQGSFIGNGAVVSGYDRWIPYTDGQ